TYADGWLPFMLDPDAYKNRLDIIKEAARKAGRDYDKITKALFASLIIDKDHNECIKIMQTPPIKARALASPWEVYEKYGYEHPLGKRFYGLTDLVPSRLSKSEAMKAIERVPLEVVQETYLWGTPEEVIEKVDSFLRLGLEHLVVWNETYFGDPAKVRSSYSCIEEVMKYFKES
ncbi:MAG: LLM class flavin-dependent oxidoreductase, partial [Candidatus Freyarchaeota archaeon]